MEFGKFVRRDEMVEVVNASAVVALLRVSRGILGGASILAFFL